MQKLISHGHCMCEAKSILNVRYTFVCLLAFPQGPFIWTYKELSAIAICYLIDALQATRSLPRVIMSDNAKTFKLQTNKDILS